MRLYDHYIHPGPWEPGLPADLIAPLKHLRKLFDEYHWSYGRVTEVLCYDQLHPNEMNEETKEYLPGLQQLKGIAGMDAMQRFIRLIKVGTAPALFKAFFDLYMDGITVSALAIFHQLAAIGKANADRLGVPHLEWAEAQSKNLVRSHLHAIEGWVRRVCDKQPYDPKEDFEEQIFWRKWRAPRLLIMKPSRYQPYEPERTWERFEAGDSQELLKAFAEHYVIHLESRIEKAAGEAALEIAKQPRPRPGPPHVAPPQSTTAGIDSSEAPRRSVLVSSSRRESQMKTTQAKYKSWQQEYKSLKKANPHKSDAWISIRISRADIARGSSSETIRKHMKGK